MKKNAAFQHFLKHFRSYKVALIANIDSGNVNELIMNIGALECLYWQALGNDLLTLAKGIKRFVQLSNPGHCVKHTAFGNKQDHRFQLTAPYAQQRR